MKKLNVLVTATGGDIAQSILKILNEQEFVNKLVCCDISRNNSAFEIYKNCEIVKKATDKDYLSSIEKIVEKYDIDIIIPVSEPELRFLNSQKIREIKTAKIVMADNNSMNIGFDKYKTAKFLEKSGLLSPETFKISEIKEINYPCILKSNNGCGSKQICLIENIEDYNFYSKKYPEFIIQEYLKGDEYTCGLYQTKNNEIRSIIFKRELKGGLTGYGELVENEDINELLIKIAQNLKLEGSINVQLRLAEKGPVVFEINPRFSSTVLFRDKIGFKDLIWSIQELLDEPVSVYKKNKKHVKFYKTYDEVIVYE